MSAEPRIVVAVPARLPAPAAHSHRLAQTARAFARRAGPTELWYRAPWGGEPGVAAYYGMAPVFAERPFHDVERLAPPRLVAREPLARLQRAAGSVPIARAARSARAGLWFTVAPLLAVLLARDGLPVIYEEHRIPSSAERLLLGRASRLVSFRAAVGVTGRLGDDLVARGMPAAKVAVLPSAVDPERFADLPDRAEARRRLELPADIPVVAYVGRFSKPGVGEKGVPELIRAAALLGERAPLLLCVGGPPGTVPGYRELGRRAGLGPDRLRFAGHVDPREVPLWIRAADVVTAPLPPSEFGALMTSPLKIPEYMAAGAAIVASDLPSTRVFLRDGENALLVEAGDPRALAAGIEHLLDDRELAARLGAAAREDVRPHTWEARADRILAFAHHASPT